MVARLDRGVIPVRRLGSGATWEGCDGQPRSPSTSRSNSSPATWSRRRSPSTNIFVFLMVFTYFAVAAEYPKRVLMIAHPGALVLRRRDDPWSGAWA